MLPQNVQERNGGLAFGGKWNVMAAGTGEDGQCVVTALGSRSGLTHGIGGNATGNAQQNTLSV